MIIEVYQNNKWVRFTTCHREFTDFFVKEAKEFYLKRYGEDVEVRARESNKF